jgi:aromatic ring-opening dioxygenase catalytic subunit (LigB family)
MIAPMPIVAAFATSHAYTFQEPETWDERRERSKANVAKKAGWLAPDTAKAQAETLEDNLKRYAAIRDAHQRIRERLARSKADAVVLIGDDQLENFSAEAIPQFLVYTGGDYVADDWDRKRSATVANHPAIAKRLVEGCLEEGFDVAWASAFKEGKLLSHAHTEPILYLVQGSGIPVVPAFVNAVHPPAPSAERCYAFGQALARVIGRDLADRRIVLCASGGLSHFSPSHPWDHHLGPRYVGDISVEFDRRVVEWMRAGEGERLARLTSRELIEHGEGELRQWIVLLGALGGARPEFLVYEPLYRSIMGMGVGYWEVGAQPAAAKMNVR